MNVLRVSLKVEPCILMVCLVLFESTCINITRPLVFSYCVVEFLGDLSIDVSWTWAVCSYPYIIILVFVGGLL